MKKILTFLLIIFFCPIVFAQDFNVTSSITSPLSSGTGKYSGTEIYNTGTVHVYNVNTRYSGRLSRITFNLPLPSNWTDGDCFSSGDLTYKLTLNMATDDWRNHFARPFISSSSQGTNWATSSMTFVSMKKVYFTFKVPSDSNCYDFFYVDLKSTNIASSYFTGETNWNLSSIVLSVDFSSGSGSGSGSGSTPTPTPGTQDIINNNNENTTNIINNNNENTTNIIENNNNNTQEIIDNQKDLLGNCVSNLYNKNDIVSGHWLTSDNYINNDVTWSYSNYISIEGGKTYTSLYYGSSGSAASIVFYDSNYNLISGITHNNRNIITWNAPVNARFVRDSVPLSSIDTFMILEGTYSSHTYVPYGEKQCTSKLDETNNAINNVNDTLNNSNIDSGTGTDFFDDFSSQDFGLSQIITIPLTTIQGLTSKTCSPLQVPIPFTNSSVTLPCMTQIYENHFGSVYNLWKIVSFGIISYFICLDIFKIVKGFKDPNSDKVEVLDL